MGSSGGKTTVQQSDPWSGQQPYLRDAFGEAQRLYREGGPEFYPEATYIPFSGQTEAALGALQARSMMGSPVESGMQSYVTRTMNDPGGGFTQNFLGGQMMNQPNLAQTSGYADAVDPSSARSLLASMDGSAPMMGQGSPVAQSLTNTMNGGGMNNPYLDGMYDAASRRVTENFTDAVMPSLNAAFAGAGGSGSGIQRELAMDAADELGQNLTDMASNIYGNNYQQERGRQLQAAGLLSSDDLQRRGLDASLYNAAQGRALTGAQTALQDNLNRLSLGADLYNTSANRGIAAASASNDLFGAQHEAAGRAAALAPTANDFDFQNIANLAKVGGTIEGKAGEILGDRLDRFNFDQNRERIALQEYLANVYGNVGNVGGTTSTTGPGGSRLAGAAGGAMSGALLASTLGSMATAGGGAAAGAAQGSGAGPWGMLAGAVLGGLLGSRG